MATSLIQRSYICVISPDFESDKLNTAIITYTWIIWTTCILIHLKIEKLQIEKIDIFRKEGHTILHKLNHVHSNWIFFYRDISSKYIFVFIQNNSDRLNNQMKHRMILSFKVLVWIEITWPKYSFDVKTLILIHIVSNFYRNTLFEYQIHVSNEYFLFLNVKFQI